MMRKQIITMRILPQTVPHRFNLNSKINKILKKVYQINQSNIIHKTLAHKSNKKKNNCKTQKNNNQNK
jgi:hypothetical protein